MGLKAEDALLQINNPDGNSAWNELTEAYDVSVEIPPNLLDDTTFGDESPDRITGLIDGTIDISIREPSASPSAVVSDIRDAALDQNAKNEELQVEFAPNGQAGGTTTVVAFTAMPSSMGFSASSGDAQDETYTLELSDGTKPTVSQATLS